MQSLKVGFIGLGNMGMPMAKSIATKGFPMTVYDLRKEPVAEMMALGAKAADSPREVAAVSDMVISMVRDIPQTDAAIFGKNGVWEGVKEGGIIVISSTIGPAYCRQLYARAKERKVRVIDACVSKSTPSNEAGQLTLMIGGDEDAVKRCWPVFEAIGKYVFYLGDIGMGQCYKLVNNLAVFVIGTVNRECLNLGLKAGLDLQKMIDVMQVSTGNSWSLMYLGNNLKSPRRAPRPSPGAPADGPKISGNKDKLLAIEMAKEVGAQVPVALFTEELDIEKVYEAYSARMKQ